MTNQEMTIRWNGKLAIIALPIAFLFAIAPTAIAYYEKPTIMYSGFSYSSLEALGPFLAIWIPFCFLTIPTIYFLCREILNLRKRVEDLEKKSNS